MKLVLAPAASGKTTCAIEAIRALPPLSSVRVLVPDQMEAVAFRRRLAQAGGAIGVEVQTFYGLYADVLALAARHAGNSGQLLPRLMAPVRHRLIRHIVQTLTQAGQLPYYAPLRNSAGFARLLAGLFGELKRAQVLPEEFESATAGGEPRLAELARIYATYQQWLIKTGWMDADGQGWLAAIALEENPALLSGLSLLVVDGFDEFNPTQLRVLGLLAGRAENALITLTGDAERPGRLAHRRSARALAMLTDTLDVEIITLPCRPFPDACEASTSPCLIHLEKHLFEPSAPTCSSDGTIEFVEAQNRAGEAREALRWIKARVVRDHAPMAQTAVIARDISAYRPFLEEVAAEFGMPLRFASGAHLKTNPAIAALLNLLKLPAEPESWSPRALSDALTGPYFDWGGCGVQPGDDNRLDGIARACQVINGLDQWREAFQRLAVKAEQNTVAPYDTDDDEDIAPRGLPAHTHIKRLQTVFERVVARITPPPESTLRDWVAWIEDLIGQDPALPGAAPLAGASHLGIVACARQMPSTAERDVAALRTFKDILRGLVLADAVLNVGQNVILPYSEFMAELNQALEGAFYPTPVEGEAVLVASALEARGLRFDSVALIGLAEGDFPRAERQDALLRESDRDWLRERGLAIERRLQGDEAAFFYQAATRANRRLLLCRPYLASDGQSWEPSPYWSAARNLIPDAPWQHVRPTSAVHDPASEQELVSLSGNDATQAIARMLQARAQADPSPWRGDLASLAGQLTARFGAGQPWSSSRLETYTKCPLYFWAMYAMELEPREPPRAGYDVMTLGSIYHLILERLYASVPDGDPDRLRAELPTVARQVYDDAPNDYGFRPTPLWDLQQEELTEILRSTLDALIEIAGDYRPAMQEMPFGLHNHPPLILNLVAENTQSLIPDLQLRGYVDRIDRAPDGRLRIIDYKAGSTAITPQDLQEGHRLQLPLYALAVQEATGAEVASGFYWHIGSAKPSSLKLEKFPGGVAGAIDTAVQHALSIASSVQAGQFAPTPPDEGCPAFCPAIAFCEQYKPKSW